MLKQISELVKELDGRILLLGIYDANIYNLVNKNEKITDCMVINHEKFSLPNDEKGKPNKQKKYHLNKIRKLIKKKNLDNAICNFGEIHWRLHHFVKNSIHITSGKVYIYGDKNMDIDNVKKRYNRYDVSIETVETEEYSLIVIDCAKAKNKRFKEIFWWFIDIWDMIFDYIGELITV